MRGEEAYLETQETRSRAVAALVVTSYANPSDTPERPERSPRLAKRPRRAPSRTTGIPFALTALKWMGIAAAIAAPWILLLTS